jgi:hypothetical protein
MREKFTLASNSGQPGQPVTRIVWLGPAQNKTKLLRLGRVWASGPVSQIILS